MKVVVFLVVFVLNTLALRLNQVPVNATVAWASDKKSSAFMAKTFVDSNSLPEVVMKHYDPALAEKARNILKAESAEGKQNAHNESVFKAVEIAFKLPDTLLNHPQSRSVNEEGNKNIMDFNQSSCVVYGAGIASDSTFESEMAKRGCEVHAFDCTLTGKEKSVRNKSFTFHPWCVGTPASFEHTHAATDRQTVHEFKTLSQIMDQLGHSELDVLKFDIEGFEWQLFDSDLLHSTHRAMQLSFELHTAKANRYYVPHDIVADKDYVAVNKLFLDLYDIGYRVISKEINPGDHACAEFVLANVDLHQSKNASQ